MMKRLMRFPGGKAKTLTFSYDDGISEDMRLAEIFKKHGLKATFNINTGKMSENDITYDPGKTAQAMCRKDVLKTYGYDNFEVAVHTLSHPYLELLPDAAVYTEVLYDRKNIEALFGKEVRGMAYPYGTYNDKVIDVCRSAGICYSRTTRGTLGFELPADWMRLDPTCHHKNPNLTELGNKFIALKDVRKAKMFYVWGHSYEFALDNNWEVIENFAEQMAGKDDIWYATNGEIYDYCRDFGRLFISADGSFCYNPTARTLWFGDFSGKVYSVAPGETLYEEGK